MPQFGRCLRALALVAVAVLMPHVSYVPDTIAAPGGGHSAHPRRPLEPLSEPGAHLGEKHVGEWNADHARAIEKERNELYGDVVTSPYNEKQASNKEFLNFRGRAKDVLSMRTWSSSAPGRKFFVSPSSDGKYIYVALSGLIMTRDAMVWSLFAVLDMPKTEWSVTNEIANGFSATPVQSMGFKSAPRGPTVLNSSSTSDVLRDSQISANVIFDEAFLNSPNLPAEFRTRDELLLAPARPPPPTYQAKRFSRENMPDKWFARISGCCLFGGIPPDGGSLDALKRAKFNREELHVINLFDNSDVTLGFTKIANRIGGLSIADPNKLSGDGRKKMERILSKARGQSVVIVGHVEGPGNNTFVTTDSKNTEIFRISIAELESMANEFDVSLLLLGCNTEVALKDTVGPHAGTLSTVHARRVVEQLTRALDTATDWEELLTSISAPDIPVVASKQLLSIGRTFTFNKARNSVKGEAEVYVEVKRPGTTIIAHFGTVWIRFKCTAFRIC